MNTKAFIVLAALAFSGTAVMADDITIVKDTFTPTKTRAEVTAEVLKARAAGVLHFVTEVEMRAESSGQSEPATASTLTREQVRAQLLKGPRAQVTERYPAA